MSTAIRNQPEPNCWAASSAICLGGNGRSSILGIIATILFTRLTPDSTYAADVLPGLIVIGLGMACIFAPAFGTATLGVDRTEAGIASAMVNTSQQVGGSVGTALLSTLFANAAASYLHQPWLA